jgi:hypothetical protein
MYGIEFQYNHPVEVTDAFVISKLKNNNHFKFEDDQSSPPKKRGGRPKGSKNKPKPKPEPEIVENEQNFEEWVGEPDGQEQN